MKSTSDNLTAGALDARSSRSHIYILFVVHNTSDVKPKAIVEECMKKRYMLAGSALILLNLTLSACSTKSSSTASKQSSKTVKVVKHKANKKSTNKDKSQSSNKQKSNKASTDKQASKSTDNKQTATTQSQQENQQQVSTNNGQQSSNQSQGNTNQQNQQPKTQGQINMERGYDPKGHPIMPGSDHAAGYNPDGTEDSWVKGQDEWLHKNGLINPDGSPTQKAKDMEAQSENDDFGEDIPDEPDPE